MLQGLVVTGAVAATVTPMASLLPPAIVEDETVWRCIAGAERHQRSQPRILAGRWRCFDDQPQLHQAPAQADHHVITIAMRRMDARLSLDGRAVVDGAVMPGSVSVTEPGSSAVCLFRGAADELHLMVPNGLMEECRQAKGCGHREDAPAADPAAPSCRMLSPDPVVLSLAQGLVDAARVGATLWPIYAESVGIAVLSRVMAASDRQTEAGGRVAALPRWRLKRVLEYVDANLCEAITLGDLAAVVGLSRMHFAAQFRVATGLRPHEYVCRRRVERAQSLLATTAMPLVEVALEVGFQTQAHFTTVFRRYAGDTPGQWRRSHAQTQSGQFTSSAGPESAIVVGHG